LYLLLAGAQKFQRTELHGVILKLRFVNDALMQRQQDIPIIDRSSPGALHPVARRACLRANAHAQGLILLLRPPQHRGGSPDPRLPLVEQRNSKFQLWTRLPIAVVPFPLSSGADFRHQ
jgi:hypothetical protein